jgi:hypothetical protein
MCKAIFFLFIEIIKVRPNTFKIWWFYFLEKIYI